jgi:hypothetical protein
MLVFDTNPFASLRGLIIFVKIYMTGFVPSNFTNVLNSQSWLMPLAISLTGGMKLKLFKARNNSIKLMLNYS